MFPKQKRFLLPFILGLTLLGGSSPLISQIANLKKVIDVVLKKKDKDEPIGLKDFPGFLDKIPLPKGMKSVLEEIEIKMPKVTSTLERFIVSGDILLKGIDIQGSISIEIKTKKMSLKLALPKGVNFKKTFPELGAAGDMLNTAIGTSYFVISDFSYTDPELNVIINPGFNFGATIDLTGPVKKLADLFDDLIDGLNKKQRALKVPKGFVFVEKIAITLAGVIPSNPGESKFSVILPWRIGLDFTKAFKDPYVKKLMTADFIALISVKGEGKVSGGLILELKSQKDPLEFRCAVEAEAAGAVAIEAEMRGKYKPAFGLDWLGIGPLGVKIGVMAAPPWLDEIAFKGGLSLGKIISVNEGLMALDVSSGNILLEIKGANLDIDDLIKLLITMAKKVSKKDIKMPKIPIIEFKDMGIKLAPVSMTVFDKYYAAGIAASAQVKIGKFGGGINVDIQIETPKFYAKGNLDKFEVKVKNKTIFLITGKGEDKKWGTKDDAAILEIDIAPYRLIRDQKLVISGRIEIPPIKFKHDCDARWEEGKFTANVETKLGNLFSGMAKIRFDTDKPSDFYFKLAMDQKVSEVIRREVKKAMTKFEGNAKKDLNKARSKVEQLDEKMNALRKKRNTEFKKLEKGAALEVKKFKEKIAKVDKELVYWKKKCKGVKKIAYPFRKCGQQIIKLELEKVGFKIAGGVLAAGTTIIMGVDIAVRQIDNALKIEEAAQKIARGGLTVAEGSVHAISEVTKAITAGVFVLESGSLETSGKELIQGKLPKVSLKIQVVKGVVLDLKNLQFDFKHPDDLFEDLAKQIVESFKKKK